VRKELAAKVVTVSVPEYRVDREPDYPGIGKKVDRVIEREFSDGKYVYRAISVDDHPGLALEQLVLTILELGTDKYDPERHGVGHDQFSVYDHDMQCGSFEIRNSRIVIDPADTYPTLFGDTAYDFYQNAPLDRGYALRIDMLILYDPEKLEPAKKIHADSAGVAPRLERYLYRFRDREHKADALLGVVKILR